jgi:hypothetical protein
MSDNELSESERIEQIQKNRVREYYKCAKNPAYFMRNYCYIKSQEDGTKTLFDLYDFQERALKEFMAYDYNVVLKTRQMGISTLTAGYSLWMALFQNDTNISYIATKQDVAQGLLKKVKIMHDNLPSFMQERKARNNMHSLELGNGSLVKANSSTSDAARSESLSMLVIDEAAFIDNAQDVWSSAKPTLSGGGEAIVLSTPYGVGSWYHQVWTQAIQGAHLIQETENREVWEGVGVNDFHPVKLHWSLHPNRDEQWRENMGKNMEPREAAREYDCSFEQSGNTVIDPTDIKNIEKSTVRDPSLKVRVKGENSLWIWEPPKQNTQYILGADVASGEGEDFSTAQIFTLDGMEQVAEYKGKLYTTDFADFLCRLGGKYNTAALVCERNSIGNNVLQRVHDHGYSNMLWSTNNLKFVSLEQERQSNKKLKPGIQSTGRTKQLITTRFKEWVRKKQVTIRSRRLTEELKTYVWVKPNKADHMSGYHDDLIDAARFAIWARDTAIRLESEKKRTAEKTVQNITTRKGQQGSPGKGIYSPTDPNTGEDLSWLYK